MMGSRILMVAAIVAVVALGSGVTVLSNAAAQRPEAATPHDDVHDHAGHDRGKVDGHGCSVEAEDPGGHDHGSNDSVVRLSGDERARYGIRVATASAGNLATRIRLPGEIALCFLLVRRHPAIHRDPAPVLDTLAMPGMAFLPKASDLDHGKPAVPARRAGARYLSCRVPSPQCLRGHAQVPCRDPDPCQQHDTRAQQGPGAFQAP